MFALSRLLFATSCLLGSLEIAHAQFATPEDAIQAIYALYRGKSPDNGPGFPSDEAGARRFLEPELARAWANSSIGADPFIDGQDWEISDLSISRSKITGDRAIVRVRFHNFNVPVRLLYRLKQDEKGWRVHDVLSGRAEGLRHELGLRE